MTEYIDSRPIHARAILVCEGHQEVTEEPSDRLADRLRGDPFRDGVGFDVAQIFEWQFLKRKKHLWSMEDLVRQPRPVHIVFDACRIIDIPPLIVVPPRTSLQSSRQTAVPIVIGHVLVAIEKTGSPTPRSGSTTAASCALGTITTVHESLGTATRRCGHLFNVLLVIKTGLGVSVESIVLPVIAVQSSRSTYSFHTTSPCEPQLTP